MPRIHTDKVASLFSGAGGFSYGFGASGLKPEFALDVDTDACRTYEINLGLKPFNEDLANPSDLSARELNNFKNCFSIIGGPPCQGFSTAGSRNANDGRNKLIFSYLHIVESLRPRWFIFENVEGLLTSGGGDSLVSLSKEFIKMGYIIRIEKINFAAFGLPQARKRVIIIGNSCGLCFSFPREAYSFSAGKHKSTSSLPPSPNLLEALSGLPLDAAEKGVNAKYTSNTPETPYDSLMRKGNEDKEVSLHFSLLSKKQKRAVEALKPGQSMKDLPEEYWHESFKKRAFRRVKDGTPTEKRGGPPSGIKRLQGELCSLTITGAASREFIHPISHRSLTLRECARIQSFPDRYSFTGGNASIAQQIGNAVPPLIAEIIANHIQKIDGLAGGGAAPSKPAKPGLLGFRLTDAVGMSPALQKTFNKLSAISCPQHQLDY